MVPSSELTGCDGMADRRPDRRVSDISSMCGFPNADRTWPYQERASMALPVTGRVHGALGVGRHIPHDWRVQTNSL